MTPYLIPFIPLAYLFVAVVYGRYVYLRHTWKFAWGDETPAAVCFALVWPISMLVQFALFLGSYVHYNTPKKG